MIFQPLFGKDSSPHKTSLVISVIATVILWIAMTVSSVFIKINPKVKTYKTVQITLDSTPTTEVEPIKEESNENLEKFAEEITEEISEADSIIEESTEFMEETIDSIVEDIPVVEQPVTSEPVMEEIPQVSEPLPVVEKVVEEIKQPEPVKTPVVEKIETPKPVEKAPEPIVEKVVEQVKEIVPEPVVEKKSEPYKPELQKSVDELMAEQMANKKQKTEIDWDAMFGDDSPKSENTSQQTQQKVTTQNQTAGSAATGVQSNSETKKTTKSETPTKSETTSKATSDLLNKISESTYSSKNTNGTESVALINSEKTGDGKVRMEMSDGSTRTLIEPSVPNIQLSDKAAALADACTVTISFTVLENGNVPLNDIKITPAAILPEIAKNEIINQINKWLFDSGMTSATASFQYTIIKK